MADIKSISERCIKHQQKYHIQVRKEYVEMMDGDTCSAILIWLFDFLDDNETTRMRVAEEEGIPWIKASFSSITQSLLGMYAERSIRDRIHFLRGLGILKVAPHSGKISLYQIDIDVLNEALTKRKIFTFYPGKIAGVPTAGKIAVEEETPAKPPAILPGSKDLSISVLERRKDAAATDAPALPRLNVYESCREAVDSIPSEQHVEGIATFPEFRRIWEKSLRRMTGAERRKAEEAFAPVRMSVAALEGAIERFAAWMITGKVHDPAALFLKNPQRWADYQTEQTPYEASLERAWPPGKANGSSNAPRAPKAQRGASQKLAAMANGWQNDPSYMEFVSKYESIGAGSSTADKALGYEKWKQMSSDERALANERVLLADPVWVKQIDNYLLLEDYTRKPRPKPKSFANDQAAMAARALVLLEEKKKKEGRV